VLLNELSSLLTLCSCVYSATRSGADVVINAAEGGKGKNKDLQGLKKFGTFMFDSFHNVL
jgi:hypothetical protein